MSSAICTSAESANCVRCCPLLLFGRLCDTSNAVLLAAFIMDLRHSAQAARTALGISSDLHEQNWTSCKVSWSVPLNSVALRSMTRCSCCLPAAGALGLLSSASRGKSGDHSCTAGPAVPMLADTIGACSTRLRGGEGGYKAREAAPECTGAPL